MNRKNMLMIALTVYLSCAEMAKPPKTESHSIAIPIINMLLRLIAAPHVSLRDGAN